MLFLSYGTNASQQSPQTTKAISDSCELSVRGWVAPIFCDEIQLVELTPTGGLPEEVSGFVVFSVGHRKGKQLLLSS